MLNSREWACWKRIPTVFRFQPSNDKFQEHQHNNPTELRLCGGVVALFMDAVFASDMLSSESAGKHFRVGVFFVCWPARREPGVVRHTYSHLFSLSARIFRPSQPTRPDALERVRVLLFGLRQVFGSLPLPCL
mmetsp:Transcript_76450/g.124278  ORF Transcript_76450/g.124278 Transcript_76450/m.124278 type:complete len:133 (+) Transcript_76450:36-434(+)